MTGREKNTWLLPEGIEEILPPDAARLEQICRVMIDTFQSWGYQLVIPPMIEYLDSLLTGTGEDLELQTFKITDLMSGRMMGIRADTTPQVARIDAHYFKNDVPERLCYMGNVLHTKPQTNGGSRSPLQVGAELFGHQGIESDVEIICLLLETFQRIGIQDLHIDIGHVGIYQALIRQAVLNPQQESEVFNILQRKAKPELLEKTDEWKIDKQSLDLFAQLIELNGGFEILKEAERMLSTSNEQVRQCLDELKQFYDLVKRRYPDAPLYFDLAELRGYHYHTGVMFSAFVPGQGSGIAFGGRYDNVGRSFGRARAATGFSTDVKILMSLSDDQSQTAKPIFAPYSVDKLLTRAIEQLRRKGEIVITELPGQSANAADMGCDRQLVFENENWVLKVI